ncbi:MAG: tetratricopeptide repeat protein [Opitutae bacterium]|nr:tetratricopeptide repeat protein [Opitutae bacterium]
MSSAVTPYRTIAVCLALFLGTLVLFSRATRNDFVNYDDPDYVTKNEHVQAGLTAATVRWAFTEGHASNWHPLTWLSHALDRELFGKNAAGHHATSVLWHACGALLAFLALRRLTGAFWASAFCAALFAWHPLRVESVAWVAERKDVLSGFFWWLTLWAYAVYAERRRTAAARAWLAYTGALVACALGLMAKPMLVTLPCVLLLLDVWPLRRCGPSAPPAAPAPGWRPLPGLLFEKVPFFALAAASCWVTYQVQKQGGSVSMALGLGDRLANAVVALARYLGKFLWPADLAVLYPHPGTWPGGAVLGALLLATAITALALWQWRRRPWIIVGWLWFVGTLVPVIGLVQVGLQSMADRYTYLPIVGVQLALIWTLSELGARPAWRPLFVSGAAIVLLGCSVRTWSQQALWQDSTTLFEHTAAVTAKNYLAYNNLGTHLMEQQRIDEAIEQYRRSLAINPAYEEAHSNLGHALAEKGLQREAVAEYRLALRTRPDLVETHNNLGNALSDLGQLDEAIAEYEFVLARQPRHVEALNNYGVALAMKGQTAAAIERIQAALALAPDHLSAHSNLGNVYAMTGRADDALREYRRVLELNPNDARVYNNLGNVYAGQERYAEAVEHYTRALRLAPVNPEAHANLGYALARQGKREEAIRHLQIALQQRPDYAQAQSWLQAFSAPSTGAK